MINKKRRTRTVGVLSLVVSGAMTKKSGEKTGRNNEIISFIYTAGQKFGIIKSFNVFNGKILTKAAFI